MDYLRDFDKIGYKLYLISGKTGEGVEALIEAVSQALRSVRRNERNPIPPLTSIFWLPAGRSQGGEYGNTCNFHRSIKVIMWEIVLRRLKIKREAGEKGSVSLEGP
jgi:hypothetical protein